MNCPHCGLPVLDTSAKIFAMIAQSPGPIRGGQIAKALYGSNTRRNCKRIYAHILRINQRELLIASNGRGAAAKGYSVIRDGGDNR